MSAEAADLNFFKPCNLDCPLFSVIGPSGKELTTASVEVIIEDLVELVSEIILIEVEFGIGDSRPKPRD
jgi:hypothetical protein